jgi:N-acetylneuraminic acid mutarotase
MFFPGTFAAVAGSLMKRHCSFTRFLFSCLLALAVFRLPATAQTTVPNEWTWIGGNNTVPSEFGVAPGVYGTIGIPAASNVPGGRSEASTWTDSKGHLWLFGGLTLTTQLNYFNDLWSFEPSINEWVWMGGSNTVGSNCPVIATLANCGQPGVYGELGTPASANAPGGRYDATSLADSSGHLWLFGGMGFDAQGNFVTLNDLWEFNPSTNEWAWIAGSSTVPANDSCGGCVAEAPAVYGTLGVPAVGNTPGGIWGGSGWTDPGGNLWLFGGVGADVHGYGGELNTLWQFNPSTGQWTWMSGSDAILFNATGQSGVYGTLGVPSAANVPGGRAQSLTWVTSDGHLWLFGGRGYDSGKNFGNLNDLWQFDPATGAWAWMSGSSTLGCLAYGQGNCEEVGVYGALGIPATGNVPGSRIDSLSWTDIDGDLWLFSGDGNDANNASRYLNDLWEFKTSAGEWAWMGGGDTAEFSAAAYGMMGLPAAGNVPGARGGSAGWKDGTGNFWVFGGEGYGADGIYGNLNDLWAYQPSNTVNLPHADFSLAVAPASMTVTGGQDGTAVVRITPSNEFQSQVTFACSGLPSGASCTFSPSVVSPSATAASTRLTIATSATTGALRRNDHFFLPLSSLAVMFCWWGRKKRRLPVLLLLSMSFAGLGLLSACGGGSSAGGAPPVQPVTSTITVTATAGSLQHTATFSLTVN